LGVGFGVWGVGAGPPPPTPQTPIPNPQSPFICNNNPQKIIINNLIK